MSDIVEVQKDLWESTIYSTLKFYKTLAVPIVLYDCVTWNLGKKDERNIQAAELKWLICVQSDSLLD